MRKALLAKALTVTGLMTSLLVPSQAIYAQSGITWFSIKTISNIEISNLFSENRYRGLNITTTDFEGNTSTVKVNLGSYISNLGINQGTVESFTKDNPPTEFTIPSTTSSTGSNTTGSTIDQNVAGEFVAEQVGNGQVQGDQVNNFVNTVINTTASTSTNREQTLTQMGIDIITATTNITPSDDAAAAALAQARANAAAIANLPTSQSTTTNVF